MSDERDTGRAEVVPKRRSRRSVFVAVITVLLLAYLASPYVTLWRFRQVLESNDRSRMERYVDFVAVRTSLKQQLRGKLPPSDPAKKPDLFSGLVERFAPALIDQLVDAFVTPDGLAALIADPQLAQRAKEKDPSALARAGTADRRLDTSEVRYAFFCGPRDFLVDVQGMKLWFSFSRWRWILRDVELPLDELKAQP
jgi:hypothetical protein